MAIDSYDAFIAVEAPIRVMAGKPVVNVGFLYYDYEDAPYDFSGQVGYGLKVWDNKDKNKFLKEWVQGSGLNLSNSVIFWNASAGEMDFQKGKRYYEAYYLNSGGYEVVLRYGEFQVI